MPLLNRCRSTKDYLDHEAKSTYFKTSHERVKRRLADASLPLPTFVRNGDEGCPPWPSEYERNKESYSTRYGFDQSSLSPPVSASKSKSPSPKKTDDYMPPLSPPALPPRVVRLPSGREVSIQPYHSYVSTHEAPAKQSNTVLPPPPLYTFED